MSKGRLSYSLGADGQRQIETSELIRVFGELNKNYTPLHSSSLQANYTQAELITQLIAEVQQLRIQNRELAEKQAEELACIRKELQERPRLTYSPAKGDFQSTKEERQQSSKIAPKTPRELIEHLTQELGRRPTALELGVAMKKIKKAVDA